MYHAVPGDHLKCSPIGIGVGMRASGYGRRPMHLGSEQLNERCRSPLPMVKVYQGGTEIDPWTVYSSAMAAWSQVHDTMYIHRATPFSPKLFVGSFRSHYIFSPIDVAVSTALHV